MGSPRALWPRDPLRRGPGRFTRSAAVFGVTALLALLPAAVAGASQWSKASFQRTAISHFADGDEALTAAGLPASGPRLVGSFPRLFWPADGPLAVERPDAPGTCVRESSTRPLPRAPRDRIVLRI
jgi:hypothetical protein